MSYLKTAADGRRLFFPWGVLGKGYLIASDADYERVTRMRKFFLVLWIVLTVVLWTLHRSFDPYSLAAGSLAGYAVWMHFTVAGLLRTDERLKLPDVMASHPRVYSPFLLWPLEIASLLFVIAGIVILIKNPGDWPSTLGGVVFFSLCAAVFAYVLVLRKSLRASDN